MDDGLMRVLQCTPDACVIHSGSTRWGIYGGLLFLVILTAIWFGGSYYASAKHVRGPSPVPLVVLFIIGVVLMPAFVSGEANTLTLSRASADATIVSQQFFLFRSTKHISLADITDAANTGRNNQLRLNLQQGNYLAIGFDTFEGGRDNAANAINAWLNDYRRSPGS